jgi:long-chain acyl-CoA synthetase
LTQLTYQRQTLVDLFDEFAGSEKEYLLYDNGYRAWSYTYKQVARAAHAFAARLAAARVGKGEKVVLWSESRPEWVAAFWGCVLRAAVVVPIDHQSSPEFVARIVRLVQARVLLASDSLPPVEANSALVWRLSDLEWSNGHVVPRPDSSPGDIAEIVFTSGATGDPKGVLITHRNILANLAGPEQIILGYRKYFRPLLPVRFMSLIPLSHMFGQMLAMFVLPAIPGTVVFIRGFTPEEITRQVRRYRVTAMIAVPKILEVLQTYVTRQFPESGEPDSFHWLRRWLHFRRIHRQFGLRFWAFIVGGAPLPRNLEEFWWKIGLPIVQGYGLTETAPIVAFNNPFAIRRGTAGAAIAGTEVRIEADGEIVVRGESISPGYFVAPPEASQAFREGWFHTGDIGEIDAAGNLVIRGRKKEVIVTPDGRKVYPEDVEIVLEQIKGVREAAVVGPDRVRAVLVVEQGADVIAITRSANAKLEDHQKIHDVKVWPGIKLPRTDATHKVKRIALQHWLDRGGETQAPFAAGTLVDLVRHHAPGRQVSQETTLDELGLSSLERVELLVDLEQQLGTSLDESQLTGASTLARLEHLSTPGAPTKFPSWNRSLWARGMRNPSLSAALLPLTRCFAHLTISGREHLQNLRGPVIFASNHQSHLDTPVILSALPSRFKYRMAVAMWKEYFDPHFSRAHYGWWERMTNDTIYYLVSLLFNGFPLPQTEARAGESLRYMGELVTEGWSILLFPEGERTVSGEIKKFQPGIGFIAARLVLPIVPIRVTGLEKLLHRTARLPRPGRVKVAFGAPLSLKGDDFAELAARVQRAVTQL